MTLPSYKAYIFYHRIKNIPYNRTYFKEETKMEISVKDFICGSSIENPKTATYGDYVIESANEGLNCNIYISNLRGYEIGYFMVCMDCEGSCYICDVKGLIRLPLLYLLARYSDRRSSVESYSFRYWSRMNVFMLAFIEVLKNK